MVNTDDNDKQRISVNESSEGPRATSKSPDGRMSARRNSLRAETDSPARERMWEGFREYNQRFRRRPSPSFIPWPSFFFVSPPPSFSSEQACYGALVVVADDVGRRRRHRRRPQTQSPPPPPPQRPGTTTFMDDQTHLEICPRALTLAEVLRNLPGELPSCSLRIFVSM